MLDSGAGGVDCIFHQEAVTRLKLLVPLPPAAPLRAIETGISDLTVTSISP
jgi:hypothetical protein